MSTLRARALARAAAFRRKGVAAAPALPSGPLRIEDAWELISNPATGKYAHDTPSRRELERALRFFGRIVGNDTAWADVDESHYLKAARLRVDELIAKNCRAVRAAEITIAKITTTVGWLREMRHIPRDAAPWPKRIKEIIKQHWMAGVGTVREPQPHRPRHTLEEVQKILRASNFDPRWELLFWLGCELRLGQVVRSQRTDLELPPVDWTVPDGPEVDYGTLKVWGSGKKGGTTVDITRGQRKRIDDAMAAGYLSPIEQKYQTGEVKDYVLFPSGFTVGRVGFTRGQNIPRYMSEKVDWQKHATSAWVRKQFREAEERAGVPHVEGRGAYGARRQGRDVGDALDLSQSAIESLGGWAPGSDIANKVYRDKANKFGRREARAARAALRGEEKIA